jgi:hypothetical protein
LYGRRTTEGSHQQIVDEKVTGQVESNAAPAAECRYDCNAWRGENSRYGFSTPDGTTCGGQQSPGHTRFLLDPVYAVVGVAKLVDIPAPCQMCRVLNLGSPRTVVDGTYGRGRSYWN